MAFEARNLQVEYARGATGPGTAGMFRRATYITNDTAAQVEAASYFDPAAARLPKGAVIQAVIDVDGATPVHKNYIVTANTGAAVTIAIQTVTAG